MWIANGYTSSNISLDSEGEEESDTDQSDEDLGQEADDEDSGNGGGRRDIGYVVGDVTQPKKAKDENALIVHCVGELYMYMCHLLHEISRSDSIS